MLDPLLLDGIGYTAQSLIHLQVFQDASVKRMFSQRTISGCPFSTPRIGILNRQSSRRIEDNALLAYELRQTFPLSSLTINDSE